MHALNPEQAQAFELLADDIESQWQAWPGAPAKALREQIHGAYLEHVRARLAGEA